jgi:hypothetical protein
MAVPKSRRSKRIIMCKLIKQRNCKISYKALSKLYIGFFN